LRWFVGLPIDTKVWRHSTSSQNCDRLLDDEVIPDLFAEVVELVADRPLLSTGISMWMARCCRCGRRTKVLCARTVRLAA
jgi:hypothetical protein